MSFSSDIKEELSKIGKLANKKSVEKELVGYLISKNSIVVKNKIKFSTESEYNINRFARLINNMGIEDYKIEVKGKIFIIETKQIYLEKMIDINDKKVLIKDMLIVSEDEAKAVVRGAFLGSGYVSSERQKNHLEISFSRVENANFIIKLLKDYDINAKIIQKKNEYSIYIKDGEEISKFLAFIGANNAVLKFEEIRVKKEMSNKINRLVNCESSNLNKTLNASVEQVDAIKKLQESNRFELLNDKLKEIAIVRLANPDMALSDLGKILKEPIGKSGVNYRLKKIIEIANSKN